MNTTQTHARTSVATPAIPLKHQPNCPSAKALYSDIMTRWKFDTLTSTLVSEGSAVSNSHARELIAAYMQWYATGSVTKTKSYAMFDGPVDKVMHTMILDTKRYMGFCLETAGVYTHHEPISMAGMSSEDIVEAAIFTTRLLESVWGDALSPHLRIYVDMAKNGTLTVASVSCTGNDGPFDIMPITEYPTFD